jgi:GH18 family chitinase
VQSPEEKAGSLVESVKAYLKTGFAPQQIVVGIPAYGHAIFQVIDPPPANWARKDHPGALFYPVSEKQAGKSLPISHSELGTYIAKGFTEYWDDEAKAGYLYSNDTKVARISGRCSSVYHTHTCARRSSQSRSPPLSRPKQSLLSRRSWED